MSIHELEADSLHWPEVQVCFSQMYDDFQKLGFQSQLKSDGAEKWMLSQQKLAGKTSLVAAALTPENSDLNNDSKLAGFIHVNLALPPSYLDGGKIGHVAHLYVRPEFRKLGLAMTLFQHSLLWFQKKEVESISLEVVDGNSKAHSFWKKCGFENDLIQYKLKV
ncbi:MAG: GNAT family N-acetyltransferase [Planctomycetes bacterium]|nr:GNAT family N-acetyltransferase [Planctomycetota bacterium]